MALTDVADLSPNKTRIALALIAAAVVLLGGYEALAQWTAIVPSLINLLGV